MDMKYMICAIIKDEHLFLKEWIDYHLSIGFDHIFLYEDFDSKSHATITDDYPQVELHSMREVEGCVPNRTSRQVAVYNNFCHNHNDGWCLFTDIDEYLRLDNGVTLDGLTEPLVNSVGLCLWWKCYGANGHIDRPVGSIQDNYSSDYKPYWHPYWEFKSFINLRVASKYNDIQQGHFINCHYHKRIVSVNGDKCDFRQHINKQYQTYDKVWIDHYITKSWEDYTVRLKRGNITKGLRDVDYFFRLNNDMPLHLQEMFDKPIPMCDIKALEEIPKILHFVWLSGDDIPNDVKHNLQTWKEHNPEFEIKIWTYKECKELIDSSVFCYLTYCAKLWAFCTDYIRFWILYLYGGIYMDSDVEVCKPFGNLIENDYFFGYEQGYGYNDNFIETAVIGSVPKIPLWLDMLHYYNENYIDILSNVLRRNYQEACCPYILDKVIQCNSMTYQNPGGNHGIKYDGSNIYVMGNQTDNIYFSHDGIYTNHLFTHTGY